MKNLLKRSLELMGSKYYSLPYDKKDAACVAYHKESETNLETLIKNASNLKVGDKVNFLYAHKVKKAPGSPKSFFNFTLRWELKTGVVKRALKHVKKSAIVGVKAADAGDYVREYDEIKISCEGYIYSCSPEEVEAI